MSTLPAPASPLRSLSRRARLARLREETEPLVAEERRTALRALLCQPLLLPDGPNSAAFTLVRRHRDWLADWFAHRADWSLVVTPEAARLRKLPATATDATRPAREPRNGDPFTRPRYVLLCLALAALERSDRQITLDRLAGQITTALAADPAFAEAGMEWSLDHPGGRRDFVHVLRYLVSLGALRRVQGDEENLLRERQADALYNISRPVLALLLAARRSPSLVTADSLETRLSTLLDAAPPNSPDARNRAHRTHLTRRLLDDPVIYLDTLDDDTLAYLERQRPFLVNPLAEATGLHAEIRAEGLALVDLEGDCTDAGLPEEGTEGHLTLLLATWLAERLRAGDSTLVSVDEFRRKTANFIRRHRHHWRKDVGVAGAEIAFASLVLDRLTGLALIERHPEALRPLPAIGRFALRQTPELAPADDLLPLS
jgi:uncharacterized protein (TIGR02678 family)